LTDIVPNKKPQSIRYFEPFLLKEYAGYYYIYYYDLSQKKRRKVSTRTKIQSTAYINLQKFKSSYLNNISPKSVKLISDLRDTICIYYSNTFKPDNLKLYKMSLNDLIKIISDKRIRLINYMDIEIFKNERVKEVSQTTVNIELRTLKSAFNIAKNLQEISENPVSAVKQFLIPEKKRMCFSDEELTKLLKVMGNSYMRYITLLGLYTGARLGELVNLQWQDVDFDNKAVYIRNKADFTTKTKLERDIPVSPDLNIIFQKLRGINGDNNLVNFYRPEDYVFKKSNGDKYTASHVSKLFKRFLRKAVMDENFHFHVLRHTFITDLIKKGVSINYVKQLAGHTNVATSMRYIHIVTEDLRQAVNLIKINY